MKKRTIATLLSLVMAFSLTACAGGSDNNNTDTQDVVVEEDAEVEAEDAEAEDAEAEDADAEDAEDADAEDTDAEDADAAAIFGTVDGDVYTNDFFGIEVNAIEGYAFADDETIEQLGYMTSEMIAEGDSLYTDAISNALESGETVIDFYLTDEDFMNSLNLTLSSTDSRLTQDDAADMIDATIPFLAQTYESMGASDVNCERSTVVFLGEDVPCIRTSGVFEVQGTTIDLDVVQVILVKDGYTATITATTYMDDETGSLLDTVTVLE